LEIFLLIYRDFTQWPLPAVPLSFQVTSDLYEEFTRNQLEDLKRKITPVQQMIISLQPKKKYSYGHLLPSFEYDEDETNIKDNDIQSSPLLIEIDEHDNQGSLSERIYEEIDRENNGMFSLSDGIYHLFESLGRPVIKTTQSPEEDEENANHSRLITYNITSYLFVFVILIIHRISFTSK
jgi:hypothetical protein